MRVGRLTVVLLVVCAALGAWVFQQWKAYATAAPEPLQQADSGAPRDSGVRAPEPLPMPPLASFSEIVERPLFVQTRRPAPAPEPGQQQVRATPGNFKLEGTALSPDGDVAVLRNTRTSEMHRVLVGQSIDGWKLDVVEPGHAALSQGAQKLQLELERPIGTSVR
ncbi:MAG: hypothetical protein QNJ91_08425 [Gammaproteobacteria bacterium]|nr:hypothetical protein [Gammaproteobacteria bacterium]